QSSEPRAYSPGRLFPSHFEGKTKNGVYIRSQGFRPNIRQSYIARETHNSSRVAATEDDGKTIATSLRSVSKNAVDLSFLEGKSLNEVSSKWLMNQKNANNVSPRRKGRQTLTRVKESLGLLLPARVSR
ncbi:hypothetical protein FHG87_020516, partial [Trinorchestia longiramus]